MSGERKVAATQTESLVEVGHEVVFKVLGAISVCHLVNDMLSSLLPAIYPLLKTSFNLNFAQIGLITLTYQTTASLLQPLIGFYTDKNPRPLFFARRNGSDARRADPVVDCAHVSRAAGRGGAGGDGLLGVSSGVVPSGAHGVRRTARPGAIAFSSGRQCGTFAGSFACGILRDAEGTNQHCLVFSRGPCSA